MSGVMAVQSTVSSPVTVTKSDVRNRDTTPSKARMAPAHSGTSLSVWALKVDGPPTGTPTVNLRARGFGVVWTVTGTGGLLRSSAYGSGSKP